MSYIALYRKWRPLTFDDVVEQTSVVSILKNAVKQGRIGHAYLFCGTRGTGKTTIAKIFSRAINCIDPKNGNPCNECDVCKGILNQSLLDVIEIDAASNNGVDNIRDIIEEIAYMPARAKYKVYIIDEVHMLSTGAFNALLKTLEEPPEHGVFLLATTDPQKLPATILSRCQRYEFKRISISSIVERLELICGESGSKADKDALNYIAQAADGALRDAISILDQCISAGGDTLNVEDVLNILGIADEKLLGLTAEAIIDGNVDKVLECVDNMIYQGKEVPEFVSSLILYFRNMLIIKAAGVKETIITVSRKALNKLNELAPKASQTDLINYIKELSSIEKDIKWSSQKKILLEVGLIKLCITEEEVKKAPVIKENVVTNNSRQEQAQSSSSVKNEVKSGIPNNFSNNISSNILNNVPGNPQPARPTGYMIKLRGVEEENLRDIFSVLKEGKHMMIMSYLRNVRALYYSENIIYLAFCGAGRDIKKESMAKPENMKVIKNAFEKILERECMIRLYTEEELSEKKDEEKADTNDVFERLSRLKEDGIQIEFE